MALWLISSAGGCRQPEAMPPPVPPHGRRFPRTAATAPCGPPTYNAPAYPQAQPEELRQPPHRAPSRLTAAASRLGSLLTAPEDSDAWLAVGGKEGASPSALKGSPTATADGSYGHSDRLKSAEEGAEEQPQLGGKPVPQAAATFGTHHGVLVSEDTFKQGGCSRLLQL